MAPVGLSVNKMSPVSKRRMSSLIATLLHGAVFFGHWLDFSVETRRGGRVGGTSNSYGTWWWPLVTLGVGGAVVHQVMHEQPVLEPEYLARATDLWV